MLSYLILDKEGKIIGRLDLLQEIISETTKEEVKNNLNKSFSNVSFMPLFITPKYKEIIND